MMRRRWVGWWGRDESSSRPGLTALLPGSAAASATHRVQLRGHRRHRGQRLLLLLGRRPGVDTDLRLHVDTLQQLPPGSGSRAKDCDCDLRKRQRAGRAGLFSRGARLARVRRIPGPSALPHTAPWHCRSTRCRQHVPSLRAGSRGSVQRRHQASEPAALCQGPVGDRSGPTEQGTSPPILLTLRDAGGQGGGGGQVGDVSLSHRAVGLGEVLHSQAAEGCHELDLQRTRETSVG